MDRLEVDEWLGTGLWFGSLLGLCATLGSCFTGGSQFLISRLKDVRLSSLEHVVWRDVSDGTVEAMVVVMIDESGDEASCVIE